MGIFGCKSQEKNEPTVKYFASWGGYKIPYIPQQEIDSLELNNYIEYYKVHYDNLNRIVIFEKYLEGKFEWSDEYFYWEKSKKLKKQVTTNSNREVKESSFTKNGKRIKD